jgi:hypothetical protein
MTPSSIVPFLLWRPQLLSRLSDLPVATVPRNWLVKGSKERGTEGQHMRNQHWLRGVVCA